MATTPSIKLSMRITETLNSRLGAVPDPKALAKYFCKTLLTIAREGLPVRVYLDHRITEAVATLLKELGVKFGTVSPGTMKLLYIYLVIDGDRLVIETVDTDLNMHRYATGFDLFLKELVALVMEVRRKRGERPEPEVEIPPDMTLDEFIKFIGALIEIEWSDIKTD